MTQFAWYLNRNNGLVQAMSDFKFELIEDKPEIKKIFQRSPSEYGWYLTAQDNDLVQSMRDMGLYGDALAVQMEQTGIRLRWLCDDHREGLVLWGRDPQVITPCEVCQK